MSARRAVVEIPISILHEILRLPDDVKFLRLLPPAGGVFDGTERIRLVIESPRLPMIEETSVVPVIPIVAHRKSILDRSDIEIPEAGK